MANAPAARRQHTVEIFSAGCRTCRDTIERIERLVAAEGQYRVAVLDMHDQQVAQRAKDLGVRSVPAVVVGGKLAQCCSNHGVEEDVVREALRAQPS